MSTSALLIIYVLAIIVSIVLAATTKINGGLFAMVFSILICYFCLGDANINHFYKLFPVKLFFTIMSITMFFGIAMENGTVLWIADSLLKLSKGRGKLIPFVLFATGLVPTMMGATGYTIIAFVAPIAFAMAKKINMKLPLTIICCSAGTMAGSNFVGGYGNTVVKTLVENSANYPTHGMDTAWSFFFGSFLSMFIIFLIAYFVWGGYKLPNIEVDTTKVKMTREQRGSFIMILLVLACILIPAIITTFTTAPAVKAFSNRFDVATLMLFGSVIAFLLKYAPSTTVIKNRVNWGTIILACGFTMLMNLLQEIGLIDILANAIATNIASWLISPLMSLIAGLMTFFVGAVSVVCPLMFPIVDAVAPVAGLSAGGVFTAVAVTACSSAISPLGTSGSLFIAQVDPELRDKCFNLQFALAFGCIAVCLVLNFLGLYSLISFK